MIKRFCDNCKEETKDQDFMCEVMVREIRRALFTSAGLDVRPHLSEKMLHFCRKCYDKKLNLDE